MEPSLEYLRRLGIDLPDEKALSLKCKRSDVEILFVRCSDIPTYIEQNVADFGIIGENVLIEQNCKLPILERLSFGECSLVIAVPYESGISCVQDLEGERIATSYPSSLKQFLRENGVNAAIVQIEGSVELSPSLNLADAVCDIRQSGNTLKENGLRVLENIFDSEAVLISKNYEKILL